MSKPEVVDARLPGEVYRKNGYVVLDQQSGGDWIDASYRWVVMQEATGIHLSVPTKRGALILARYPEQAEW